MDESQTITHHPSEVLRQVATAMNWRDTEISVRLPTMTTWKVAIRATDAALGERDGPVMITPRRTERQRQILRQVARENVQLENSASLSSPGLRIRTRYNALSLPLPERSTEDRRKWLKEDAKPFDPFLDPYSIILRASMTEKTLPMVKANLTLSGIDSTSTDPSEVLKSVDMLWDTGAHQTIITEDLLSDSFREYLRDHQHDPYRFHDGLRLQMDAIIGLSNVPVKIAAIIMVVSKSVVPNGRVGVLFGQRQCIDHLSYRSIPRRILERKAEEITKDMWGDIVLEELIDEEDLIRL